LAKGEKYISTQAATDTKNKIQLSADDFFSIVRIFAKIRVEK
jgi:hypothetical protein